MSEPILHTLASASGIAVRWTDAFGCQQEVKPETLRAILLALGFPADSDQQCKESLKALRGSSNAPGSLPPLITAWCGTPVLMPSGCLSEGDPYSVKLEQGGSMQGRLGVSRDNSLQTTPILEAGYHLFEAGSVRMTLAVAPRSCFRVCDALQRSKRPAKARVWGLAAQLYSMRRVHDGGLGDYTSLEELAASAGAQGASALAISPVHAMFSADASRFSPYGPSSRVFLNVLHVDPAQMFGQDGLEQALSQLPGSRERMVELEGGALVDWPATAALRLSILRQLFDHFNRAPDAGDDTLSQLMLSRAASFKAFCERGGQALEDHARFEALDAWFRRERPDMLQGDWRQWPKPFQDPRSLELTAFAHAQANEVAFHQFLQWLADAGVEAVHTAARNAGMPVGVIADLAVGADPGGSQAWGLQSAMLAGLSVGAPPDLLSQQGQGWGLCAFSPRALQAQGFAPWLDMLRANMRHSGGIRIDHVLGLKRLWLVPDGAPATDGAYLRYPFDDLIRLAALESNRHGAIVIGEDLGTVPEGFGEQLASAGVLGIRVLHFQKDKDRYLLPDEWSSTAMATTSTHDLATVAGWWAGRDIDWRERMNLLGTETSVAAQRAERETEKQALWHALRQAKIASDMQIELPDAAPMEEVFRFTGRTPAPLVMVPLEDVLGMLEQPNLPGTVETHPNWQLRLQGDARHLLEAPVVKARLAALQTGRDKATTSASSTWVTMPADSASSSEELA